MKYKLKKDLPSVQAGAILIALTDADLPSHVSKYANEYYAPIPCWCPTFHIDTIKANPDWFEEIPE